MNKLEILDELSRIHRSLVEISSQTDDHLDDLMDLLDDIDGLIDPPITPPPVDPGPPASPRITYMPWSTLTAGLAWSNNFAPEVTTDGYLRFLNRNMQNISAVDRWDGSIFERFGLPGRRLIARNSNFFARRYCFFTQRCADVEATLEDCSFRSFASSDQTESTVRLMDITGDIVIRRCRFYNPYKHCLRIHGTPRSVLIEDCVLVGGALGLGHEQNDRLGTTIVRNVDLFCTTNQDIGFGNVDSITFENVNVYIGSNYTSALGVYMRRYPEKFKNCTVSPLPAGIVV